MLCFLVTSAAHLCLHLLKLCCEDNCSRTQMSLKRVSCHQLIYIQYVKAIYEVCTKLCKLNRTKTTLKHGTVCCCRDKYVAGRACYGLASLTWPAGDLLKKCLQYAKILQTNEAYRTNAFHFAGPHFVGPYEKEGQRRPR
ncbi:uncharacterized protein [Montipora foliosa]|uniref:uncharacterized protein isoform X2 n=1 Tax=Montipora foliosa TaxID=591990 RepID=UPI0035F17A1A